MTIYLKKCQSLLRSFLDYALFISRWPIGIDWFVLFIFNLLVTNTLTSRINEMNFKTFNNFLFKILLDEKRSFLMGQRFTLSFSDIKMANLAYNCDGIRFF